MAIAVERLLASGKEESLQTERVRRPRVPDPLEGVIDGENRHERYTRFMRKILGRIWPQSPESGEYGDDFWRSTRFEQGDLSGYTHSAPDGRDPLSLTPEEFETFVQNIGTPDYVRVRIVPPSLLKPNVSVVPVGGSCPIETWGMRNIADISGGISKGKIDPTVLPRVARRMIEMAPTISHISGAMLTGQDESVHYVESDMWTERLVSYGIPKEEATLLVRSAYDRINEAVARKAKLINPNAKIINVNFDEMSIQEAVRSWFNRLGIEYDPKFRAIEVIYTYDGPHQKQLLEQALTKRLGESPFIALLIGRDFHLRTKQIDHGRWGSMNLPKEVIAGRRGMTDEERGKYESDYPYRMGIRTMQDVYDSHVKGTAEAVFLGFADLPGPKNSVQHESRKVGVAFTGVPGTEEFNNSLEASLNTPARLHNGNVEEHLKYLNLYLLDISARKQQLVARRTQLSGEIGPLKKTQRNELFPEIADKLAEKTNIESELAQFNGIPKCFPLADNAFIQHAMQFLWDPDFVEFIKRAVECQNISAVVRGKRTEIQAPLKQIMAEEEQNKAEGWQVDKNRIQKAEAEIAPLLAAVKEEEKRATMEANTRIRRLMEALFPKLQAYLLYLYGKIDYPSEMRNKRIFNPDNENI